MELEKIMSNHLINSTGCPICNTQNAPGSRLCGSCGAVLLIGSVSETVIRNINRTKIGEAVTSWRSSLDSKPDDITANYSLGLAYYNSGLKDAALMHLRKTVLLAPEVPDAHFNLAMCLFDDGKVQVGSLEYDELVKEINYAIKLDPLFKEANAFKHLFMALKLQDVDVVDAINEYSKSIKVCPDIAVTHNNLGLCYAGNNQPDRAEACFLKAIDMAQLPIAYSNMCWLCLEREEFQAGINWGKKALEVIGDDSEALALAHNNIALCYKGAKSKDQALLHIKKAIALEPDEPLYHENLEVIDSNCFVMTATMGDYSHPWVIRLSKFRDQILAPTYLGNSFINLYYEKGPIYAKIIGKSNILRLISLFIIVIPSVLISLLFNLDTSKKR